MNLLRATIAILCLALPTACGDDGDDDDSGGGTSAGGSTAKGGSAGKGGSSGSSSNSAGADNAGGSDPGTSRCEEGCVATLEADCPNGPATQEQCVQDCEALQTGDCAAEYAQLQGCAQGNEITCGPGGIPVVEACADQQDAFIACLN